MVDFFNVDVKGGLAEALGVLIHQRMYVPGMTIKPSYEAGTIDFLVENPAQPSDEDADSCLLIAEIDVPAWREDYGSGTPSCTEDEFYENVFALSRDALQTDEWNTLLQNYSATFGMPNLEFEVVFEMDGFLLRQAYPSESEEEAPQSMEDMYQKMNEQQAAAQQYTREQLGTYGQTDEQTRAAFAQQAQAGMQAAFAQMGLSMPEMPNMDMNAMMQQAQANMQMGMSQMTPEMMAAYGMDMMDDEEEDDEEDESWQLKISPVGIPLSDEQGRMLAFGAPMYVYRAENVNTLESGEEETVLRGGLADWWDIVDRESAMSTLNWLLNEGHSKQVDYILDVIRQLPWYQCREYLLEQAENEEEAAELIGKYYAVKKMKRFLLQKDIFEEEELPASIAAWDYVRAISVGRWCRECGYITDDELWNIMGLVQNAAKEMFASWTEYGISFAFGRGVWRGEEDDCATGLEITESLIHDPESPWVKYQW